MKNQQGAPEALPSPSPDQLRTIARTARNSSGSASDDCGPLAYVLHGWRAAAIAFRAQQAALVEAQQPAAHVQNPAEIEHVAGDVSKNGAESNMAQQPAPSAAAATEVENLRKALQFYADKDHFTIADEGAWDTVSGEPQNYWCDEEGTATVEDGTIARLALAGHQIKVEADEAPQPSHTPQADSQPAPQGETNAQLDIDSNSSAPGQQRDVAGSVALGQPVGNGSDQAAGHTGAQGDKLLIVAERNIRSFLRSAVFKSESDREAALNCVDVLWEAASAPADSQPAPVRDYPPLPARRRAFLCTKCGGSECEPGTLNETHPTCKCGYLGFAEDLDFTADDMRAYVDADRAARAPADSVLEEAERWRMLPAFFEEYQIDAMKLYRDIDAAIAARKQGGA